MHAPRVVALGRMHQEPKKKTAHQRGSLFGETLFGTLAVPRIGCRRAQGTVLSPAVAGFGTRLRIAPDVLSITAQSAIRAWQKSRSPPGVTRIPQQ